MSGARSLSEETGVPLVKIPGDVGGTDAAGDYFALMDALMSALY